MAGQRNMILKLVKELEKQGWDWRMGSKHVVLYPADKRYHPFTIASTPSDGRAYLNMMAQLKRAGAKL